MFQDRRVRQALAMLWDFEWSNRQMMRNMYIRQQSYFSNTDLAARELPDAAELKILNRCAAGSRRSVHPGVRGAENRWQRLIRDKQLQALDLLEQAGWKPDGDQLVNAEGEPLSFTFLVSQNGMERLLLPYKRT
jgi:microcin C transport system substrate-binding protein